MNKVRAIFALVSLITGVPLVCPADPQLAAATSPPAINLQTNKSFTPDAGTNSETSAPIVKNFDAKYRLAIGDQIRFQITQDGDDPQVLLVDPTGEVDFPYLGRTPAAGKTCQQLASALKAELEKTYYYHATVIISVASLNMNRGKAYVGGAVKTPGTVEIRSDEPLTLSEAILRAGGFADFADQHHVRVTRRPGGKPEETITTDVRGVLESGKIASDLQLQPGDFIYVPERLVRF